jgi:hypothetical protein
MQRLEVLEEGISIRAQRLSQDFRYLFAHTTLSALRPSL